MGILISKNLSRTTIDNSKATIRRINNFKKLGRYLSS